MPSLRCSPRPGLLQCPPRGRTPAGTACHEGVTASEGLRKSWDGQPDREAQGFVFFCNYLYSARRAQVSPGDTYT